MAKLHYILPGLLAFMIFGSNFLSTDLFQADTTNFAVWFVLSVFCFATGWLMNKLFGWVAGGRWVFSSAVATAVISLFMVTFFSKYFNPDLMMTESLILYSLRNIFLGAMALFGMAVAEVISLQKQVSTVNKEKENHEELINQAEQIADLRVKEAKLKADKILLEAEKKSLDLIERKQRIQDQLREFITTEKELIKKYESEEID